MKSEVAEWKIERARHAICSRVSDARSVERLLDRNEVRACVRAFDGKVVNKRFFDALAVATGHPPSDSEYGRHSFGCLRPYKHASGYAFEILTTRSNLVGGFACVTNEHGRLDAAKTLELIEARIAEARKVAETDWNGQLDGLVAGLNEIGKRIDVLKGSFDEQLWYDLDMQRLLLFY